MGVCYNNILVVNADNSRWFILKKDGALLKKTKNHTMKDEN